MLGKLFSCNLCWGTWSGFLIQILFLVKERYINLYVNWVPDLIDIFLHGLIGGAVSITAYLILKKLGFD